MVLKMCNISTESQECYVVRKLYIPAMVPIVGTHYSREKSRLYSTFQNTNVRFSQKDLKKKKKKRLKKNSFPFYSCSTEEINSHYNDIFTHRNKNPVEALLNWYLFCTILDEDRGLVLVIQRLSSSIQGRELPERHGRTEITLGSIRQKGSCNLINSLQDTCTSGHVTFSQMSQVRMLTWQLAR